MDIREEIEQYLNETGLKRSELARRAGVNPSLITRILSGEQKEMILATYRKIKEAMSDGVTS